jgi:two-component system, LytTR family, response regulator
VNILIIEDEELVAISLMALLSEIIPTARIQGPIKSVAEGRQWLNSNPEPDLILSDIQLSDGVALDIFKDGQLGCPIIFTTAYSEYAIKAFKLNSIDYLLKPVDKEDLQLALQKMYLLKSKSSNYDYIKQMMEFFADFRNARNYRERFTANVGRAVTLVPTQEIAFFLKEELIYIVNKEGKKFITDYRSLDEIQEVVDPAAFYRANRQYLVHLQFIEQYRSDDTSKLIVKIRNIKTDDIVISKEKAAEFRKWFG